MSDLFSGRKIIAAAVLLVTGLGVTYLKGDLPPNLLSLMQWIFITFVAGNAAQHFTTVYGSKTNSGDNNEKT